MHRPTFLDGSKNPLPLNPLLVNSIAPHLAGVETISPPGATARRTSVTILMQIPALIMHDNQREK